MFVVYVKNLIYLCKILEKGQKNSLRVRKWKK